MSDLVIVLTTVSGAEEAETIARTLVEERLAACVNALPAMMSTYRWEGKSAREAEQQLIIKTLRHQVHALERRLRELHPYEVPELIVLEASGAGGSYLAWVVESVGTDPAEEPTPD